MNIVYFKDTYVLCGPSKMSQGKTTWNDKASEDIFQVKNAWKDPSEAVKTTGVFPLGVFNWDIIDGP